MNRGIKGEAIFPRAENKRYFLGTLREKAGISGLKVLAYCIMDNHYHIVVQNTAGRLSQAMKQINGQYGIYYRARTGGRGYVFQNRYKSTLIQEDEYLKTAIAYTLLNPVRAGIVKDPYKYRWSSINEYFSENSGKRYTEAGEVEGLFGSSEGLEDQIRSVGREELEILKTAMGDVLGEDGFIEKARGMYERRHMKGKTLRRRSNERIKRGEETILEFEEREGIKVAEIDTESYGGKRQRARLLVALREDSGLTYAEIMKYPEFHDIKLYSMGRIYRNAKTRSAEEGRPA